MTAKKIAKLQVEMDKLKLAMKDAKKWYDVYLRQSRKETGDQRVHYEKLAERQASKIVNWKGETDALKKKLKEFQTEAKKAPRK